MTTETSTPTIDALAADVPVESAPKTVEDQPSTQVESESAAPSEMPTETVEKDAAPAETNSQADTTGEAPANEAADIEVAKIESTSVNEKQEGIRSNMPDLDVNKFSLLRCVHRSGCR